MRFPTIVALIALTLLGGCTSYLYTGSFDAKDSFGNDREFQVYWRKTEYALIYGVAHDPISLCTEGSLNTVLFEDTDQGIVFRKREPDRFADQPVLSGGQEICGRVLDADQIEDIEDGADSLSMEIWCRPASNRSHRAYLQAVDGPYLVDISRMEVDADGPLPSCR